MAAAVAHPPSFSHPLSSNDQLNQQQQTVSSATGSAGIVNRGPVTATFHFYKAPEDGSQPYNWVETQTDGQPQRNFGDEVHQVQVRDIRGRESEYSLDKNAFEVAQNWPHNEAIDWNDDSSIQEHYYPEVERLLLEHAKGSNRVLIFDHTIRGRDVGAKRGPVQRAHIDQTGPAAEQRVHYHLPDEAEKLLQSRYRIINVWRPLNGKVESNPLAFAASHSVPGDDMVPVEHRYPTRTGYTAAIRYSPDHQWHYLSGIDNDERLFLQCYDSDKPDNRVPHSAFVDPRSTEQSKPRESIEVRALVFG